MIANACQKMLLNSEAVTKLARQNMTLAEKIRDAISEISDKIKAAFADVDFGDNVPVFEAARAIENVMDRAQALWDKALEAATENYNEAQATGKKNTAGNGGVQRQAFEKEYEDYNKPITADDVIQLRSIGRKSVNRFTSEDLKKAQKWAAKYFQQMGVKSPFFRAWFGEWRSRSESPVSIATIPRYEKTNEFRKSLRGTYDNADTGWSVAVSREGESNTISHAGSEKLSELGLAGIKSLIENAVLLDTEVHEHHSNNAANELIAFDHRLYALGENEQGEIGLYRITVEEYYQSKKQQNEKRFHNLKHIEKIADIAGRRTYDQRRSGGSANGDSAINYTIADLYSFVKKYDSDFNVNEHDNVSPTLLNQDGMPRVVFHSTDAKNIDIFQSGNSAGIIYFAFTERDAKYAARGTKYVRPYYLSISSPVNTPDTAIAWHDAEDSSKVGQWRRQGHDAVFVKDEAGVCVAVFNAEQIKSATDNIGTFDRNNPYVRFQMLEPVEQTDKLVTVHNKSVSGLRCMLQRGGVPFPSIAIKKDGTPHEGFGDVSIVFPRSTIDPAESRWNRLYSNDAWTPTEPRTEYEVVNTWNLRQQMEEELGTDAFRATQLGSYLEENQLARDLETSEGDIVRALKGRTGIKYAYFPVLPISMRA